MLPKQRNLGEHERRGERAEGRIRSLKKGLKIKDSRQSVGRLRQFAIKYALIVAAISRPNVPRLNILVIGRIIPTFPTADRFKVYRINLLRATKMSQIIFTPWSGAISLRSGCSDLQF